jgi:hypothetical protein
LANHIKAITQKGTLKPSSGILCLLIVNIQL